MIEYIYSSKSEIEEYRNKTAVSYSLLKSIMNGNFESLFMERDKAKSREMLIGSVADHLLTMNTPLEDEYAYYNMPIPKAALLPVFNELAKYFIEKGKVDIIMPDQEVLDVALHFCRSMEVYKTYKDDTIKKMFDDEIDYLRFLIKSNNKTIIDNDILSIGTSIADKMKATFYPWKEHSGANNVKVYFQKPIYFTIEDIACKALPDVVVVINDSIVNLIDIKTSTDFPFGFELAFYKFGYNIQCAFYKEAVNQYFNHAASINNYIYAASNSNTFYEPQAIEIYPGVTNRAMYGIPAHMRSGVDQSGRTVTLPVRGTRGIRNVIHIAGVICTILKDDDMSLEVKKDTVYSYINDEMKTLMQTYIM